MDAGGWAVVIGAIFLGLTQLWGMWLAYKREEAKIERDRLAAQEVKEVKNTLASQGTVTTGKIDNLADKVEVIHKATNSLTDRLVSLTDTEAFARGKEEERLRTEATHKGGGVPPLPQPTSEVKSSVLEKLRTEVKEIPEKTAERVVEKLQDETSGGK